MGGFLIFTTLTLCLPEFFMKDKLIAFGIHLVISLLIALVCSVLVFYVWNPYPLYLSTSIIKIFFLMLIIDLIVGPILTFIVYKKGKRTLIFDLIVIAALQLVALGYGLHTIFQGRPGWIVYNIDRFELIRVNDITTQHLKGAKKKYQSPRLLGVTYVNAKIPLENLVVRNQILFEELNLGISPAQRPDLYLPITTAIPDIKKHAQNLEQLKQYNDKAKVEKILNEYPLANAYLPLKTSGIDMTVLVNREKGEVVKIVDLRPWK